MMFLIEIYTSEENTPAKALPIALALHQEFPKSSVMHLAYVSVLYQMKKWSEMTDEAQIFLERSEREAPYYRGTASGRRAIVWESARSMAGMIWISPMRI